MGNAEEGSLVSGKFGCWGMHPVGRGVSWEGGDAPARRGELHPTTTSERTSQDGRTWRKMEKERPKPSSWNALLQPPPCLAHPSASQAGGTCQTTRSPCSLQALPKLCLRAGAGRFEFQACGDGSQRSQGTPPPPLPN